MDPEGKGMDLQSDASRGVRQERKCTCHEDRLWEGAGSGLWEASVWGLHCEEMGHPHEQQELAMLSSSCGQAVTSNVCREEMGPWALWWGDKGNARPCKG